jgi:hypothetical protein
MRKAAKQASKEFARTTPKSRRRWPWVLGLMAVGAVAGYVALTRKPEEVHLQDEQPPTPDQVADPKPTDYATNKAADAEHARNGQVADRKA